MENALEIKNLNLCYGSTENKALNNLSLTIRPNSLNVILGQNGSGKSSLLRCLSGLQGWDSGEIFIFGQSRKVDINNFNKNLMLVSEDLILPDLPLKNLQSVYQNLWPIFDLEYCNSILNWGAIMASKRPSQLSKGQKILTQFAFSLATRPNIILIDEVTAALDPYIRTLVSDELVSYRKKNNATILLATNIATEFDGHDVDVFLMRDGGLYMNGKLSELQDSFIKIRVNPKDKIEFLQKGYVGIRLLEDESYSMIAEAKAKAEFDINFVNKSKITLEEIFILVSNRRSK